ncbi:MAG: hypothetical protein K940chlam2_01020 [Chlamydiae bacterium]|nr:hypothetical protein [Chlamydiota bacterium]
MKTLDVIVAILLIIGGLNWGLMGFFDLNFLGMVFGYGTAFTRLIYCLIGVSALYCIFQWKGMQKRGEK